MFASSEGRSNAERAGEAYYDTRCLGRVATEIRRAAAEFQRANLLAWGIGRAELQERLGHRASKARFGELLEALAKRQTIPAPVAATSEGAADAAGNATPADETLYLRPDAVRVGSADRLLSDADRSRLEKFETLLRDAGASPLLPAELDTQLGLGPRFPAFVSLLEERGVLVKVAESLLYHREALDGIEATLRAHLSAHDLMSMADFKNLTGLSRKYAVPLLEYFDRKGLTSRHGDNRRPGPLLSRA